MKLIGPGDPVRLTTNSNADFAPAWSPDGRYLAFLRDRDDSHNDFRAAIIIIPSVGGPERELAEVSVNDTVLRYRKLAALPTPFLAWSPDGKWILSVDQRAPGESGGIVRISVESGEKRYLTSPPAVHTIGDSGIAVSPDGATLAFTRHLGAFSRDIYVLSLTADMLPRGEPRRLTFDKRGIEGVAWAADGRSLVFSSARSGRLELWRLPVAPPGPPVRVTAAGDEPRDVAVSHSAHHLVYSHQFLDWNIWRLPLNKPGQQPKSVISSTRLEFHARYSPDGKRIVYESNRSGDEEIWTANADGSHPVQMTSFGRSWAGSPRWSPDGTKIAFDADAGGGWGIYVISAQGGTPVRLTPVLADNFRPSWSRDGKWIYYCSTRTGLPQVWKVAATGGAPVQVTRDGGAVAFESPDGEDLYYNKNEPGLWKVPVRGGAEIKVLNSIAESNFAPTNRGLYFVDYSSALDVAAHVKVLDYSTHAIRTLATLPGPVGDEMSISPDGQFMLFCKADREGSELMLIENFR
jgi:Tol biopolymer transport system component